MLIEQLREARDRRPFRPFEIHLAGGESYAVKHPENIAWDEETRVATCLSGRVWVLLDVDAMTSVTTRAPKRTKP
jgi:hypothetical protein